MEDQNLQEVPEKQEVVLQTDPATGKPVHPKSGAVIKIIGANCEFCGINASKCVHAEAFRATGMLQKSDALKEEAKLYRNFDGLPDVRPEKVGGHCEHCGVDAAQCAHAEERRRLAGITPPKSRERVERSANGAQVFVKEPEDQSVTEETFSGEEAQQIKSQVAAQQAEHAEMVSSPEMSDDQAGEALGNLSTNEGVGDEDVDV